MAQDRSPSQSPSLDPAERTERLLAPAVLLVAVWAVVAVMGSLLAAAIVRWRGGSWQDLESIGSFWGGHLGGLALAFIAVSVVIELRVSRQREKEMHRQFRLLRNQVEQDNVQFLLGELRIEGSSFPWSDSEVGPLTGRERAAATTPAVKTECMEGLVSLAEALRERHDEFATDHPTCGIDFRLDSANALLGLANHTTSARGSSESATLALGSLVSLRFPEVVRTHIHERNEVRDNCLGQIRDLSSKSTISEQTARGLQRLVRLGWVLECIELPGAGPPVHVVRLNKGVGIRPRDRDVQAQSLISLEEALQQAMSLTRPRH